MNRESPVEETSSRCFVSASVWEQAVEISLEVSVDSGEKLLQNKLTSWPWLPSTPETSLSKDFSGCWQLIWSSTLLLSVWSRSGVSCCSFAFSSLAAAPLHFSSLVAKWRLALFSLLWQYVVLDAEIVVAPLILSFGTCLPVERVGLFPVTPHAFFTRFQTWSLQQKVRKRKRPRRKLSPPITREIISKGPSQLLSSSSSLCLAAKLLLFFRYSRPTWKASKHHKNPKTRNSFMLSICK